MVFPVLSLQAKDFPQGVISPGNSRITRFTGNGMYSEDLNEQWSAAKIQK
jgi:hypothetical protein